MSLKKIIVTGGTGYIGSHTTVELIQAGYEPVIMDNLANSCIEVLDGIKSITGIKPEFEHLDLCDKTAFANIMQKHKDAVGIIHFAALKSVAESTKKPLEYYQNNVSGLMNVLRQMKLHQIPNLIFSSSCTVYGQAEKLPVTEEAPIHKAESPYGFTKQIGEQMIVDCTNAGEIQAAISLRYFNPVGAHHTALIGELPIGIPNNLLPFITQTAIGIREKLLVFGNDYDTPDGTCIRDYIHIEDLAKAHVTALKRLLNQEQSDPYEVYNIGTGNGYSVLDVIRSFEKVSGQSLNYEFAPRRAGDIEAIFADPTKAFHTLNWKTQFKLDDMTNSAWLWQKHIVSTNKS